METVMTKEFGLADAYQATRMTDHTVLIMAWGQAPNLNTVVTLEMLPWRIYPPHFGLFFEHQPSLLPARRPFVVWGIFPYPKREEKLTILDAAGRHSVDVLGTFPFEASSKEASSTRAQAAEAFIAYQQLGVETNCMIAPADAMVPMIYRRGFGPATYAECQAWVLKNCGKSQ
jgi:hypothetical protein